MPRLVPQTPCDGDVVWTVLSFTAVSSDLDVRFAHMNIYYYFILFLYYDASQLLAE